MSQAVTIGGLKEATVQVATAGLCLLLSVMAFTYAQKIEGDRAEDAFRYLVSDSQGALETRMESYLRALDSGAALLAASDHVSRGDWVTFTEALHLETSLPGILGLGYIVPVERGAEEAFLADARADGVEELRIHPEETEGQLYVIKYIEPVAQNRQAVGLNIAFETGRRQAANLSRDTGAPQITQRIFLVQDNTRQPGFLLLRPHYRKGAALTSVEERRAAFLGWVYTPFVGASTIDGLTLNQGVNFELAIYEGEARDPERLIFESAPDRPAAQFAEMRQIDVFGQTWTISWASTPGFEAAQKTLAPILILGAGLALSALLIGMINLYRRRQKVISDQVTLKTSELNALQDETRSVWENAVVPILVLNDAGNVISDNPAARALMGPPDEPLYREIAEELFMRVSPGDPVSERSLVSVHVDAEFVLLDVQRNRWTAPNGEGRTTMIVQNVTEERAAARRVEETEQRWDLALKGAQIGVFDIDLATGSSVVSQTWKELMHFPEECSTDTQTHFLSRIHPRDLGQLQANDRACIEGRSPRSTTEFRIRFGEDDWRWMRSDAVIVEHDDSGAARRMVGAQTDITDIRRASEALEASRARFRLLLENAPVGMSILDENGIFIGLNSAMCDLVGYSQPELLNTLRFADLVSREDILTIVRAIGSRSAERAQTYQAEHLIRHKDGREIWGLLSISWGFDPIEKRDIYIAQVQDITEKKTVEKLKNSFVATVSHELRTPLTSIKGALGLVQAKSGGDNPGPHDRLIEIANKNTDRLIELVNDILDFERIMAGEMEFDFVEVHLQAAIGEAVRLIQPFAETHGTQITLDMPSTPILARADTARLAQVLANLLSNACKFASDDGQVRVKAELVGDRAVVYVQDNGDGVPSSFHSAIFRPFSQADGSDTRVKGGTGLGLSISREIIERMEGTIGFESPRRGLTVFWFSLPAEEQERAPLRLVESRAADDARLKVLHIEDDPDFAEVVATSFDDTVAVRLAASLADARAMLRDDTYDVVVVDWSLPDGDGADLLDEIEDKQPQAAIIGLSADTAGRPDRRVRHNLVKSRQKLDHVIEMIRKIAV